MRTRSNALSWATSIARGVLGAVFIWLGATKAADPVAFMKVVREFGAFGGAPWLNVVAIVLPWLEVILGVAVLAGVKPRATALLQGVLLVGFSALVLKRALALGAANGLPLCAIRFDCGCGSGEVAVCSKLLQNAGLVVLAVWVVVAPRHRWCLWEDGG